MNRIIIILFVGFIFTACSAEKETPKPLKQGMPGTVTLNTGDVVYDLNGEWDADYDFGALGSNKDRVKITQQGYKFVGIKLIGNEYVDKGSESIKGELEKNGFRSLSTNTVHGWIASSGKINDKCTELVIKTQVDAAWQNLTITLTRK